MISAGLGPNTFLESESLAYFAVNAGGSDGGGGTVGGCLRRSGPAVGFGKYHAGSGVLCSCCHGQNSSPREGRYQMEVGRIENSKSPP